MMKNKKVKAFLSALLVGGALQASADEARLLRFPTTNGSEIVFSYAGDLYKVPVGGGEAIRLTSHIGYEMFAKFSPNGKNIAFTGQYDGNTEVYTIPVEGGEPLRISYTPTNQRDDLGDRMGPNNMVMGWTPDGKQIVYRNRIGSGFVGKLYQVDKEGGLSSVIPLPEGGFCCYSPDGKELAYNRVMREFRTWKYYRGGMADDVWVYNQSKGTVENVTNNPAQDIMPMWIGDEIFFISDRDRIMNIFVYNTKSKQTSKVTDFKEYDVKFPSCQGNMIVFENGGFIYKMDAVKKKAEKVTVTLTSDNIYARGDMKDGAKYISNVSVAPQGERVAVTARGEVFSLPTDKGVTRNITRTPGAHERNAQFSPDGKYIAFISDRSGETEIYLQEEKGGEVIQLTKNNDTYIRNFQFSYDGKKIFYTDRKNRLVMVDVASKNKSVLVENPTGEIGYFNLSSDNNWLTYSKAADNNFGQIFIMNLQDKKEYPVTDKWYSSGQPTFSEDGKYLFFNSDRDFNPIYSATEWNHAYGNMGGLYMVLLQKDTASPFIEKDAEVVLVTEEKKEEKNDKESKKENKKEEKQEPKGFKIDFEGIGERVYRVPVGTGWFGNLYSANDKVFYSAQGHTKYYDLKTLREDIAVEGAAMGVAPGSKKALFWKGGQYYVADVPNGKIGLDKAVNTSNMKISTDYTQEWTQIFDEAWRAYRDGFYVENMHGVDWKAMKQKYAVMLPYVKTRLDLNYLIGELIGELDCGHAYVNPGEMDRPERISMGLLGAEVSRHSSGFFKLEKILEGANWSKDLRSPLTEQGIDAKVGYYIVSIDGVATNTVKDMYKLLVGKANVPTELLLNSKPSLDGAHKVVIAPLADEDALYHYAWVQNNLKKVEKASGGKIGYIYIPDMGVEGLNEFSKYFYPQLDKEALIIDDRANGGGNVSPMILERLARQAYRLTTGRQTNRIGTIPNATQVGPKVCLINKYSASDGDLFPWGFRALGLGKLIGTRTWGGIVGISGSLPFVDGTDLRVPFFTSLDRDGNWIIENEGVRPDIEIDNDPIKEWSGEDQQLDKAIEELMKELKDRKPLPTTAPKPRVWNGKE